MAMTPRLMADCSGVWGSLTARSNRQSQSGARGERSLDGYPCEALPSEGLNALVDQRNIYAGHHVGIVGAGVSGLAAAATLKGHGVSVTLWDKGFNPGGRVARRPTDDNGGIEHGTSRFNIYAQHLQSQRFREHVPGLGRARRARILGSRRPRRLGVSWSWQSSRVASSFEFRNRALHQDAGEEVKSSGSAG